MSNNHIPNAPPPVLGGTTLVSHEIPVPGGTIHNTVVVTPTGDVLNSHLTHTPAGGGKKTSIW